MEQQTFTEQAGVRYAMIGKGKRVHYSPRNDNGLCGRAITAYLDAEEAVALFDKGYELCAPCHRAAEKRAEARRLADASPLAAAVVDLVDTIEQTATEQAKTPAAESTPAPGALVDPWTWIRRPSSSDAARAAEERAERRQHLAASRGANAYELAVAAVRRVVREMPRAGTLRVRVVEGSPEATLTRDDLHALAYSGHTTADAVARVRAAVAAHIRHGERDVHVMFPALGMRPALYLPDVMALLHRWDDDQAEAEKCARAVDAVEHAEHVEAGADTEALYAAALVTEAEGTWRGAWIGAQDNDAALFPIERDTEQGALFTDRAAVEQRVVEGVVVEHAGVAAGSTPSNASHPDVAAARIPLARLRAATMTDHHDVTEPTEDERTVRGYLVDPRGQGRVALYWLEEGRIVRRDEPDGASLDCLAWTMERAGWTVERLRRSSQCVFAHRPTEDAASAAVEQPAVEQQVDTCEECNAEETTEQARRQPTPN